MPDRVEETVAAIRKARDANADVLVTMGGASVGDYDLVQKALAAEGIELSFWKIAMRPGRPLMHGRLGTMHVLGLPGNPVSAYVCAFLFLLPLLRKLAGRADTVPTPTCAARLGPAGKRRAGRLSAGTAVAHGAGRAGRDAFSRAGFVDDTGAGGSRLPDFAGALCGQDGRRFTLRYPQASILENLEFLHLKLRGCGTHIEHIVYVHDLFRIPWVS